jgi:YegS/Rv2252/BmrU family lipid kinase
MKSLGCKRCSANIERIQALERPRRIRMAGKAGSGMARASRRRTAGKKATPQALHRLMQASSLPRQAILLVNAASRSGADAFKTARDKLIAAGIELIDAKAITDPDALEPETRDAVSRAPMVIVGGGDGSLSTTIDHFLGTRTVFAVLPLGTANSFARALGIPLDLDGAIKVIATGERRTIDLGEIDGDYFVNTASIGLSPMIAQTVPSGLKRRLGRIGYLAWAVRCAFEFQPFLLKVENGSTSKRLWSTEVRIANGGHFGGVELVENAALDSGDIVVEVVTGRSLLRLAWSWFAAVLRLSRRKTESEEFRGREFRLKTRPRLYVSIDGELSKRTPITARVARSAIEVAAPRGG